MSGARWAGRALVVTAALVGAVGPRAARAQDKPGAHGTVELNGSLFFGSRSEWLVAGHTGLAQSDSTLQVKADFRVSYAESAPDTGRRYVSARTWRGTLNVDYLPYGRWSPFVLGTVESSLQLRIRRRYNAGAGAKYTLVHDTISEVSLSAAMLYEHTSVYDGQPMPDGSPPSLARWSGRFRVQHRLNDHLRFSHVTFYQPQVRDMSRFTVNTTTTLLVGLVHPVSLTATLQETFDSEARSRGARSNNDGQVLVGVRAEF